MTYVQERRQELLGDRRRKFYRDSRAAREQVAAKGREDSMRAAVMRLQRILL